MPAHIRALLPDLRLRNLPANDRAWQERDKAVAAERERERNEQARAAIERRDAVLLRGGVLAEDLAKVRGRAPHPAFDINLPGVLAMAGMRRARILSGSVGTGKTLAALHWLTHFGGPRPMFLTAPDLEVASPWDHKLRDRWREATGLVLDDLGTEDTLDSPPRAARFLPRLAELVNHFTAGAGRLVITLNMGRGDFKQRYPDERMISRLRGVPDCWRTVRGQDMRGKR